MFKVEIQPEVISKYPIFMRHISATDIEIIVLEQLHVSLFTMQKLVYSISPR